MNKIFRYDRLFCELFCEKSILTLSTFLPSLLLILFLQTISGSLQAETGECSIALLLDQPPKVVLEAEASLMADTIARLDRTATDLQFTIIHPDAEGRFLKRDGSPVTLDKFQKILIFQGDTPKKDTDLFNAKIMEQLKAFSLQPQKGIVLTGGACALFDKLGFGPIEFKRINFGDDRAQVGIVPVRPDCDLFAHTTNDRQTIWMSNACYFMYTSMKADHPDVVRYATTNTPYALPLLAGLVSESKGDSQKTSDVKSVDSKAGKSDSPRKNAIFVFPWLIHPVYDHADIEFRSNFENMLLNLVRKSGTTFSAQDLAAPNWIKPDFEALRLAIDDLAESFGSDYPDANQFKTLLTALEKKAAKITVKEEGDKITAEFAALQKKALLANPTIDFDEILLIRRDPNVKSFPENYNSNSVLKATGYKNELIRFNLRNGSESVVYKPAKDEFVGDIELHYDANKLLFSMPDMAQNARWRVWELPLAAPQTTGQASVNKTDNKTANQASDNKTAKPAVLPLINDNDVDNYDACYLPDGRIVFCSTACFTGVPCINGSGHVCNLYLKEQNGAVRQLTIEQDHDWCPTVMNNGRIMYLRWEYTDLPHAFSRILFHMNPDGTNQSELYGSGSYWPNSMFYARPIPDHPTKFVAIVTGHHELNRIGDLVVFDPAKGRQEAEGAIQRIPGRGKRVLPVALDLPIAQTWPKFVHPFPLSEKYFLVSCKMGPSSPWTICLVDVFDNIVPIKEEKDFALYEPVPIRKTERQTIIPDRIDPKRSDADVFIADIYQGQGLKGVPRGTVKALRLFSYQFSYQGMGAEPHSVGLDGPWDPKRIIGTVPVYEDGSAFFKIPAYTPLAFQPLDANGKAIQLMRSWITAMPGESISCIGCHEKQNETSPTIPRSIAAQKKPAEIIPFYGPARGFSFEREIQPILDQYCVECHQPGSAKVKEIFTKKGLDPQKADLPDFRTGPLKPLQDNKFSINTKALFSPSYYQLRRFVRTPTKESQMPVHKPYEFHADSTHLIQHLQKGHYAVKLDTASLDRLYAWIDLNAPYHGNWGDIRNYEDASLVTHQYKRRTDLRNLYAGQSPELEDDPTVIRQAAKIAGTDKTDPRNAVFTDQKNPLDFSAAKRIYSKAEVETIPLANGIDLKLVSVPGTNFQIGQFETTNEQFKIFRPSHDTGIEYGDFIHFSPGEKGHLLSLHNQPVARVTWFEALAFCDWLSKKTGRSFTLPTWEQWRFAALAGAQTPFWFGAIDADFSTRENLSDLSLIQISKFSWLNRPDVLPAWRPGDKNRNDRIRVSAPVGSYEPNPWKLYDMQGNVAEWTVTESRNETGAKKMVVAGGSWYTPPKKAGADNVRRFEPQANIFDVGFRVISVNK